MEEQKNNQEQLEEIRETPVPSEETPEVSPADENVTEETAPEVTPEPVKKATPGKIAAAAAVAASGVIVFKKRK